MEKATTNPIIYKKIIAGELEYNRSREFLEMSTEGQRFLYYGRRIYDFTIEQMCETDIHVIWSESQFKGKFNNRLFYVVRGISGMTYEKKTKTLNIWFGKIPKYNLIMSFLSYMNASWHHELPSMFKAYTTASLLKDIAKGKVTSVSEYAVHLSKRSLMFKGLDPKLLCGIIYTFKLEGDSHYVNLDYIGKVLSVAKDKNDCLAYFVSKSETKSFWRRDENIKFAMATGEKMDFSSDTTYENDAKRIAEIYNKMHEELIGDEDNGVPF